MTLSANEWADQQWGQVDLGDVRLNRRAAEIGARMAAHPEASLPNQMQSPSMLEAAYRLMGNQHVSMQALLAPHCQQTLEAARQQEVTLWVEDTTELDYTAHASKTGLGPIGNGHGRGLLLHCTLGLVPESRTVIGLGHVQVVLREPRAKKARGWMRTPEGRVWEHSAQAIGRPPVGKLWIHVSDRGSDIFEHMATCVELDKHFLLRVCHNRVLTWNDEQPEAEQEEARKLLDYARSLPEYPASSYTVEVAATQKQPARQAHLALAWTQAVIAPPSQAPDEIRQHKPLTVSVLRAWEPDAPSGVEAVEWVLLTSLPILSLEDAQRATDWYTCRWFCEDFHQCLKTGCRVECSQLSDGLDIQNLLGFAAPIAVRLLQLRQEARHAPDALATTLVDPLMVEVLARQLSTESASTMTILLFWRLVARLGGFQGRKRDGQPGWRTVWRGWRYLSDLTDGARLFVSSGSS